MKHLFILISAATRWFTFPLTAAGRSVLPLTSLTTGSSAKSFVSVRIGVAMISGCLALSAQAASNVLVAASSSYKSDVVTKLQATGIYASVGLFDTSVGTPTLAQMQAYDTVFVFSDSGHNNPTLLGDNLANYVDGGGGVVLGVFTVGSVPLQGRLVTGGYQPFNGGGQGNNGNQTLTPVIPGHPLLAGVNSFNGGTSGYYGTVSLAAGATLVANWSGGAPLVIFKQISTTPVVALNFYPPSSTIRSDFWTATTDGVKLMTNAIEFVSSSVATNAATAVASTSATLNGTVNPRGLAATAWFEYGTSPTLVGTTSTSAQNVGNGTSSVAFSEPLSGLAQNTTYYFRAVMNNSGGTKYGNILSFVTGPEISVEYSGAALGDGGPTINLGSLLAGSPSSVYTFTIRNLGSLSLTGIGVSVDGPNAASFSVSAPGASSLAPGASTTFTVQLPSTPAGTSNATLRISSNDADENPFDIALTATGVLDVPAYSFTNSTSAPTYSLYTFGSEFTVNTTCTVTALGFYDHNQDGISGNNPVGLWNSSGTLLATTNVSNADPLRGVFRYRYLPTPVVLTAGQTYRVGALTNGVDPSGFDGPGFAVDPRITFVGQRYSNQTGVLTHPTNSNGTSPGIWGAGMLLGPSGPEIAVEQPVGTNVADGGTKDFGTVSVGSSTNLTFTIKNTGNSDLTGLTITKDSAHAGDFTITASPTAPVSGPSGSTTFTVQFTPGAAGTRTAAIHIANNDSNEHPFDINLTGIGNTPPTFAGPYPVATAYQTAAPISLGKLLTRGADADGHSVSVTAVSPASAQGGTVVLGSSILYTPPNGFSGADSFTLTMTDALGATVQGTVAVTVGANPNGGGQGVNPPQLTMIAGGDIGISFQGIPGRSYQIQRSPDMSPGSWQTIATVVAAPNGVVTFTDEDPPPGSAYYRMGIP